ncbi:MAG: serine hydrolase [Candidatus Eisenbacteria bacterium]|nr:serine hydrolase [Candidatus Eisenbacteria bacterium]
MIWRQVCLVLPLLALAAGRAGAEGTDPLEGYWASEEALARPQGTLVLDRSGTGFAARFGPERVVSTSAPPEIAASFPQAGCALRGRIDEADGSFSGFWIQEGDQGQPLAAPLELERGKGGRWQGEVPTLDLHFSLYLRIFRREDGVLIGAFRNPERNTRGGGSRLFVQSSGDSVRFLERIDDQPGIVHHCVRLTAPERIRLPWPEVGRTLELVRRRPEEVAGYFPRPADNPPYAYNRPESRPDGWTCGAARDVGFDEGRLVALMRQLSEADPAVRHPDLIHSLLVARRGTLVVEEYFFGHDRESLHDLRSAGKTMVSVLMGAAMEQGAPVSPESKVRALLGEVGPVAHPSADKDRITLAHLMTHTSGLAANDNDEQSPGSEDAMQSQSAIADWCKFALDLPMAHEPGTRYAYASAGMNLAGGALAAATEAWLPELFDRLIARPLEFGPYAWNLAPNGAGYAGGGQRLRPRDLLKIGQLYLDGGTWQGRRILSPEWIEKSTTPIVRIDEATTGLDTEALHSTYFGGADALAWHCFDLTVGDRTYREFEASGNGGQMLVVIPELELTVVLTGGNYNQGFIWGRWREELVAAGLIPALTDR